MTDHLPVKPALSFADIASLRSSFYRFLSVAFRYPAEDVIEELKKEEFLGLQDKIKELYPLMPAALETIEKFKREISLAKDIQRLQVEFTRLFIGPFHLTAPPYESVYREESRGLLMGDSTIDARRMYLEEGLDVPHSVHDLPDHILAELEFMSYLSEQEASACGEDREKRAYYLKKQDAFMSRHLTVWIPEFSLRIFEESKEEFYRLLSSLTDTFIRLDFEYIKALMML